MTAIISGKGRTNIPHEKQYQIAPSTSTFKVEGLVAFRNTAGSWLSRQIKSSVGISPEGIILPILTKVPCSEGVRVLLFPKDSILYGTVHTTIHPSYIPKFDRPFRVPKRLSMIRALQQLRINGDIGFLAYGFIGNRHQICSGWCIEGNSEEREYV